MWHDGVGGTMLVVHGKNVAFRYPLPTGASTCVVCTTYTGATPMYSYICDFVTAGLGRRVWGISSEINAGLIQTADLTGISVGVGT